MGGAKRYPSTAIRSGDGFREGLNPSELAHRKKDVDGRDIPDPVGDRRPAMTANSSALAVAADRAMPICAPGGDTIAYLSASMMV
jgi:hypothetical protein